MPRLTMVTPGDIGIRIGDTEGLGDAKVPGQDNQGDLCVTPGDSGIIMADTDRFGDDQVSGQDDYGDLQSDTSGVRMD